MAGRLNLYLQSHDYQASGNLISKLYIQEILVMSLYRVTLKIELVHI